MNNDAAILTVIADLQRDKVALTHRIAELQQQLDDATAPEATA